MKITKEQQILLDGLICERLCENPDSGSLIRNFENSKGELIVQYLKDYGIKEDAEGSTAYYIVRTQENDVLLFFSLKCGVLFDPLNEAEVDHYRDLPIIQALDNAAPDLDIREKVDAQLKEISQSKGISIEKARNILRYKFEKFIALRSEKETEPNENIARVSRTYPGIELVHFCTNTNDKVRERWNKFGFKRPMGEIIFWSKISPKFFEVQRIVGCEYAYLFAADLSENRTLINYYNLALKFEADMDRGTTKPFYDFSCSFMCQKLSKLEQNRNTYFENFNIDEDDLYV